MKVLSLFDGISCGMIALDRLGIDIESYDAYEIDENAIKISKHNYPNINHHGDVTVEDFTKYEGYDLLIGGSPCTNWSCAKNHKAKVKKERDIDEGIGWELFKHYVRALHEAKPKYFIYENNYRISSEIIKEITKELGVEPIMIDSALVSAQRRKRLYWTNIPNVEQPTDRGITIADIYIEDKTLERYDERIGQTCSWKKNYVQYYTNEKNPTSQPNRLFYMDGKAPTLQHTRTEDKCKILIDKNDVCRFKIPSLGELEQLQTLPIGYTSEVEGVSVTNKRNSIGNGWTVDVIAHIMSHME